MIILKVMKAIMRLKTESRTFLPSSASIARVPSSSGSILFDRRSFSSSLSSTGVAHIPEEELVEADEVKVHAQPFGGDSEADPLGFKHTLLQPRVVVYDGVCHLCHKGVKWIIRVDKYRKIKFCCLQSQAAEPYLTASGLEREDVLRSFLFVEGFGSFHQGSTAALKVMSYLPLPYSALGALMIIPIPLRDAAYAYIAKRRYDWFGKDDNCLVMREQDLLERFIDRDEILEKSRRVL